MVYNEKYEHEFSVLEMGGASSRQIDNGISIIVHNISATIATCCKTNEYTD